jgi:hypothetical protein
VAFKRYFIALPSQKYPVSLAQNLVFQFSANTKSFVARFAVHLRTPEGTLPKGITSRDGKGGYRNFVVYHSNIAGGGDCCTGIDIPSTSTTSTGVIQASSSALEFSWGVLTAGSGKLTKNLQVTVPFTMKSSYADKVSGPFKASFLIWVDLWSQLSASDAVSLVEVSDGRSTVTPVPVV